MKKHHVFFAAVFLLAVACQTKKADMVNPFLTEDETPFQVPPFDQIKVEHYLPALEEGIKQHDAEIDAIVNNTEEPTFQNTILAFDQSGELYNKVQDVFFPLNSANTNDEMQALAKQISPLITKHEDNVSLNAKLFNKIKAIYDKRNEMGLDDQQIRLVEKFHQDFVRDGANLPKDKQEILRGINEELSKLSLQFSENVLFETNKNFRMVVDNEKDLAGLPADAIAQAADQAKRDSMEGKWVFMLTRPSMTPFLQYAENRDLREKLYRGYFMRGDNNDKFDNKEIIKKTIELRNQKSQLLGFNTFADYIIDINMAKTPSNVYDFLLKLWEPTIKIAKQDVKEMQAIIDKEGGNFKLASWDWWYYAEKLRKARYNLDENEIKPYFSLENTREGMFYVAQKLYGIIFTHRPDLPVYQEEAMAYEVKEADGSHLGVLYLDFHPRDGKRVGAWCTSFRPQMYKNGEKIAPVTSMVMNFTRPSGDSPALLSFDEVTTMWHEFGHALHSLFTDGLYKRTSRSVPRDFVELPSQVMENWAADPEVMKVYAKHYKTGEAIPDELINKIEASGHFNQGFLTGEYLAASLLDLDWHTKYDGSDVNAFEKASMDSYGLIDEMLPRYRSTYFSHIFTPGYAAGYYVYIWAAQLDTDAFKAFKETGDIYNPELAARFRELLAKSGSDEGMNIYRKFRGKDASIDALLEKRGLK
ncbi:MAG: peptidase M3 [Bacteroidetes bacterium GWF2_42_66]|nr:MAG: peptidase M3 [Bacteroidetes bacterium GWA2_42_15]OFY00985.1 MAG: peptidase M3 [Bacteroidetes bacterium GWE2_42_39]OFY41825.1 MAG: peptidase M3 [Bacteroidetes bacterium GWF2_42_66]HBL78004.1 peptidase M3 [Prolixibacteraceae bacterium]HCR90233.1 peptidase M3 [Prolixibacteraceae bacterium]